MKLKYYLIPALGYFLIVLGIILAKFLINNPITWTAVRLIFIGGPIVIALVIGTILARYGYDWSKPNYIPPQVKPELSEMEIGFYGDEKVLFDYETKQIINL